MAERRGELELLPGGSAGVWEVLPATLPQLVETCLQDVLDLAGTPLAATIKDPLAPPTQQQMEPMVLPQKK